MAVGPLTGNKLRSALTILGVVIGVTSIVGMTSLIRGFGDQMEGLVREMGSDSVYLAKMSLASFVAGQRVLGSDAPARSHRSRCESDQERIAAGEVCGHESRGRP